MAGYAIVLDLGKTLSKASLWSPAGELVARRTRANAAVEGPGYPALDAAGIENWLGQALAELAQLAPVSAIIPVAHGAGFAVLRHGSLALPPMDYELELTDTERATYLAQRSAFALTGSPALPAGLNLGAQLHALESQHPGVLTPDAVLVPWAQYWAWRLCGVAASEVTSLGCHTDLWCPLAGDFSPLAVKRGWAERFAPVRQANDILGTLLPEWSARTGLETTVRVHCGLHDSNAALLAMRAYAETESVESTVLSTGTWFVAMRTAASAVAALPEERDCLLNVDAFGRPVPSARFMGGREVELLLDGAARLDVPEDQVALVGGVANVLAARTLPRPTQVPACGPWPRGVGGWHTLPTDPLARRIGAGLYAALMADSALELMGSAGPLVVEGRFAAAEVVVRALASLRPGQPVYSAPAETDVSFGALCLLHPGLRPASSLAPVAALPAPVVTALREARTVWRQAARLQETQA